MKIEFTTDNAAFEENGIGHELEQIFRTIVRQVDNGLTGGIIRDENGLTGGIIRDENGNTIGQWSI